MSEQQTPPPTVWGTFQARDALAMIDFLVAVGFEPTAVYAVPGTQQQFSTTPVADASKVSDYDSLITRHASQQALRPELVRAVIQVESGFNARAVSNKGAIGLMQLMPATARALGVDPSKPEENIEGGVRYLAELIAMFGGIELALVAYNGGPGFARRYARGDTALYGETRDYVRKVLRRLQPFR